jgi:hypothetical protein
MLTHSEMIAARTSTPNEIDRPVMLLASGINPQKTRYTPRGWYQMSAPGASPRPSR